MTTAFRGGSVLLSAFALFAACGGPQAGVDGKTSWLGACHDSAQCVHGLTCECGVCTRKCTRDANCSNLGARAICGQPASSSLSCDDSPNTERLCVERPCDGGACQGVVSRDAAFDATSPPPVGTADSGADVSMRNPDSGAGEHDGGGGADDAGGGSTDGSDGGTPPGCPDADGDGVCDAVDRCPGANDRLDSDGDGRPDGCEPALLFDVNTKTTDSYPQNFTALAGSLYFLASDGAAGTEARLCKSDLEGSSAAVVSIAGLDGKPARGLRTVGNRLFFQSADDAGTKIWVSDGTAAGTQSVTSIAGFSYSNAGMSAGGFYYFTQVGTGSEKLWRSDGTEDGTTNVLDGFYPSRNGDNIGGQARTNWLSDGKLLYFLIGEGGDLFRTDGTAAGTFPVTDNANVVMTTPGAFALLNGRVYFIVGSAVWSSDGTVAGTHQAFDAPPNFGAYGLAASSTRLFISSSGSLWASTGDGDAPTPLGSGPYTAMYLTTINDTFYAYGATKELWSTDATMFGTTYRHFDAIPDGTLPYHLAATSQSLFLPMSTADGGTRLFSIQPAGATEVSTDVGMKDPKDVTSWGTAGDRLFFAGKTPEHGEEPWVSDGTPAGTHEITDINRNTLDSGAKTYSGAADAGSPVFFTAKANDGTWASFVTRGTPETTSVLRDEAGNVVASHPWLTLQGREFFIGSKDGSTYTVYRLETDGRLRALPPPPTPSELVDGMALAGDSSVYFPPELSVPSSALLADDPTLASASSGQNVSAVLDWNGATYFLNSGLSRSDSSSSIGLGPAGVPPLVQAGGYLYYMSRFEGAPGFFYNELLRTDGIGQVEAVTNSDTPPHRQRQLLNVVYRDNVYYVSDYELYRYDGTTSVDLVRLDGALVGAVTLGDALYVVDEGGYLWITKGSPSDFHQFGNLVLEATSPPMSPPVVYGDLVYFVGHDDEHGTELWRSDGTAQGTFMEADINPGTAGSYPHDLHVTGDALYFTATSAKYGDEPWILHH